MSEYSTKARPYIFNALYYSNHPSPCTYRGKVRIMAYDLKEAQEQFKMNRWTLKLDAPPELFPLGQECTYSVTPEITENEKA